MKVTGLFIYPVKSMRAVPVAHIALDHRGLAGDRRWMVVGSDNRFLTQRTHPHMATFQPRLEGEQLIIEHETSEFRVSRLETPATRVVTVWSATIPAADAGDEAAEWLSSRMGLDCRLVRFLDTASRNSNPRYSENTPIAFQDAYPVLATTTASLEAINRQMTAPVAMERFRPNIVVQNEVPWDEDGWCDVRVGNMAFKAVKPCDRCIVTTTDQHSGQRQGIEPLATLRVFHKHPELGPTFGMNLVHREPGTVRLGDEVSRVSTSI